MSLPTLADLEFNERQRLLSEATELVINRQWAIDRASNNLSALGESLTAEKVIAYAEKLISFALSVSERHL